MAFVLYLDRVCVSQAMPQIQKEFSLSDTQASIVFMAFTLAYGLFEVPTGHWGDKYGSRRILTRIVIWWSGFTAATALCFGFYSLVTVRFLFGAGEAGAYPNAARVIARWFPKSERGRVQGVFQAASLIGGALAPAVAGLLIRWFNWRISFFVFGATGIVWALVFHRWFRDNPAEHPAVNEAEAQLIGLPATSTKAEHHDIPWREVLTHPCVWLLSLAVSCSAFNTYLYFSWYPKYLQTARGVEQTTSGLFSSIVLTGGMLGTLCSGAVVDWLNRRGLLTLWRRRAIAAGALTTASLLLVVSMHMEDARWSACVAALSCFSLFCQQSVWWTSASEVAGRYLGALFGLMNGLGGVGAMSSQFFFGWFADHRKALGFSGRDQYDPAFWVYAGVLLLGATCWLFINPTRVIGGKCEE